MAPKYCVHDSNWPEVKLLNGYATLLGFLRLGERGFGVLVFTWTTVVLLGGFVSDLKKKDFWCLTLITLIQTFSAGVFDSLIKEESSDTWGFLNGLLAVVSTMAKDTFVSERKKRKSGCKMMLGNLILVVQLLVLVFILCPLVVVFFLGLYISTGISLWRLIEHDYGNADGGANQMPALDVLYCLAVAQGVLLSYRLVYTIRGIGREIEVARSYSMDQYLILGYLFKTMKGCKKNPMFSRGRNLVTYAVDLLMESKSNDSYLSGVRILGTVLQKHINDGTLRDQATLVKQKLTGSASLGHIIQRLIETMGTGSPDSTEIREHAARIVAHVADAIHLRYFPGGIPFLSFLLTAIKEGKEEEPYEECRRLPNTPKYGELHISQHERGRQLDRLVRATLAPNSTCMEGRSTWLVVQGLRIIQGLTAEGKDNCRIIIGAPGLMSIITGPLTSQQLHNYHHGEWSIIADASLALMSRLMATPGEAGTELHRKMSGSSKPIISALGSILACPKCEVLLIRRAVQILMDLSMDPSNFMDSGSSSINFTWILLHMYLIPEECFDKIQGSIHWKERSSDISRLAGKKLSEMFFPDLELSDLDLSAMLLLHSGGSITFMLVSVRLLVDDLTGALVSAGNISSRIHAAEILDHLCRHYTTDDEYLKELKKGVVSVMPKVLKEILGCDCTREVMQPVTEPKNFQSSSHYIDLEIGVISQGNAQDNTSSTSHRQIGKQTERTKLQEALLSLCNSIRLEWYCDPDVTCKLDEISKRICEEQRKHPKSLRHLLYEAESLTTRVENHREPTGGGELILL